MKKIWSARARSRRRAEEWSKFVAVSVCKEESRCVNDLTLRSRGNGVVGGAEERLISSRRFDENVGESESPERHHDTGAVKRDDES